MNKQNNHIKNQLNKVLRAVEALLKQGATVLGVELNDNKPRIEIQYPTVNSLGETLVIRGTQAGVREEIKYSTFKGCTVFWKS